MLRNFPSPKSQVELWGGGGEAYGIPDDTLSHHHLKDWQENFLHPKVKKFSKSKMSSNFLSTSQEIV